MSLEKPRAVSLTEHTARTLRQAILRGELKPGSRLVELAIAQQMGISRGPVREAIQQLAAEGLLVIHPRRGAEVRSLDAKTAWEVQTLRGTLEAFAVRLGLPNLSERDMETLQSFLQDMQSACASTGLDVSAWIDADLSFHGFIVDLADHKRLSMAFHALDPLHGVTYTTGIQDVAHLSEFPARHQEILNALRAKDVDLAVRVVTEHYERQADYFRTSLSGVSSIH
jgi:DNA-binding GntR family transcriptional regulator